jgi:Group 4 capsule polysaccharide lipoprotein gfcB, YjbF
METSPTTSMKSSIHKLFAVFPMFTCAWLLAACSGTGNGTGTDAGSVFQLARDLWSGNQRVSLEEAASVPYASLGLRVGDSSETMLVLASDDHGRRLWTSAERIAVTTQDGRIVRTAGLQHDLGGYEMGYQITHEDGVTDVQWQADFPELGLYSVAIKCTDRRAGNETITIMGKAIHTYRIDETCFADKSVLDWSFKNTYWLDPSSGLAWRSIQHVNPRLDPIEMEILRPPA